MERFRIYLYSRVLGEEKKVVITNSEAISEASTFDENFTIAENDKITLTFSIYDKLSNGENNPFMEYLVPEAILGLELLDREKNSASLAQEGAYYKLKIVERSPVFSEENIMFTITAIDYANAVYSKQAEGLTIDKTGSLREIAEEILGQTRKNTLFKDLSTDISKIDTRQTWIDSLEEKGVKYSLPYINYEGTSMSFFRNNAFARFYATDKFEVGQKYELEITVVAAKNTSGTTITPIDFDFGLKGKTKGQSETFNAVGGRVINFDKSVTVRSEFTFAKNTDHMELYFYEITDAALGSKWPTHGKYEISITNVRITKSRKAVEKNRLKEIEFPSPVITPQNQEFHLEIQHSWESKEYELSIQAIIENSVEIQYGNSRKSIVSGANKFRFSGRQSTTLKIIGNQTDLQSLILNLYEVSASLYINHLENFKDFQLPEQGKNVDIRMTFSINNSNLYNSLTQLAALFEAEIKFDYLENAIYFVSKKNRRYKGYDLDPRINLSAISRPESSSDFATIFHVEGSGDVDGIVPAIPKEWRRFLAKCADEDFKDQANFKIFDQDNTYASYINTVYENYRDGEDSASERLYEITKFAEHMDKMPNFESTLYDFSYFDDIGLLENEYVELVNLINNTVRKLNISLNVNTYRYYTIYSEFATQLQQVAFYTGLINAEEKFIHNTEMRLEGEDAPAKYTSSWVAYKNAIDAAQANIVNFSEELELVANFNTENIDDFLKPGTFVHNACMLFGYQDKDNNGLQEIINENEEKIAAKDRERSETLKKVSELEAQLEDEGITSYVKESLQVELAGLRSQLDTISNFIGRGGANRGSYKIENAFYDKLRKRLANNTVNIPQSLRSNNLSLFKLLFDRENPHNLVVKKEKELEKLMERYETFSLEARYQNNDEVTPEGLLEQGLLTFIKFNRPKVSYNISAIHIGALKDYSFVGHPEIGDKIKVHEDLYLSYEAEDTDYLVVIGYKERLREPQSLELQVEKDDESELLVRRMIEQTNFVQFNKGKPKSNRAVPIPRELENSIDSIDESLRELYKTELSIVSLFDEMQ